jgi:hypothetical protein
MVGDIVFNGSLEIGRVTQIDRRNGFIYLNTEVSLSAATLTFRRAGQDISTYFDSHSALYEIYLQGTRLTGSIPKFAGCRNLGFVYLNNNLLTTYLPGTLQNITGANAGFRSTPQLRRFFLTGNALTKESIRSIISDAHSVAVYFRSVNVNPNFIINLFSTKYNAAEKEYQNWTRAEIFDQVSTTTNAAGEEVTIPDPLETKFNQLGSGNTYPNINIQIF